MKNILITISLGLLVFLGHSQKKDIEVVNKQTDKGFILSAVNNSKVQQEVTLTVAAKNLKGYKAPITKLVPAKTTVEMVTLLFVKNKQASFQCSYTFKPKLSDAEKKLQAKRLEEKVTKDIGNINEGIVVFSKDGCSRCHLTTSFMLDNNIDFKMINTSAGDENDRFMWDMIKKDNPLIKRLTMPVILIDGKISYNINDLKGFVAKLKKK
jgi:glutaredoxin